MSTIKAKTFIEALKGHHADPKKTKKFLSDKRLTLAEKKILQCWLLIGDSRFFEILSVLDGWTASYDPLVEGQRNLILGITLNNKSECHRAIPLMLKAYEVIRAYPIPGHHFIAINNLFIAYQNFKDENGMKFCLDEMEKMHFSENRQKICLLHNQFSYFAFRGELKKAWAFLKEAEGHAKEMSPVLAINQLINVYVYYVKAGRFEDCFEVLQRMKKLRKFYQSENYNFMKMMLDHYVKNEPLYVYAADFEDHPILYHQLRVIQFLEEREFEGARKSWKELQRMVPHVYQGDFDYQGDVSIFSLCLKKHQLGVSGKGIDQRELPHGKEERLLFVLKNSSSAVKKETLYELIWGTPMRDKTDVIKLKKLVSRLRLNAGVKIIYRKGCYQLDDAESRVA